MGPLHRILWHLRTYLPDLVLVGGWVPHLYRAIGDYPDWTNEPAGTREVDLLVDGELPRRRRSGLADLLREAGFKPTDSDFAGAVWERAPDKGETIEFLVPHVGTALEQGMRVPVRHQEGVSAISLEGLDLLRGFTRKLEVTVELRDGRSESLWVVLPLLGAFLVNKGLTFPKRGRTREGGTNPKRGKDLLYLYEVTTAGDDVVEEVTVDLGRIATGGRRARRQLGTARNNLILLLRRGSWPDALDDVSRMVAESSGSGLDEARARILGHLEDLLERFEKITGMR